MLNQFSLLFLAILAVAPHSFSLPTNENDFQPTFILQNIKFYTSEIFSTPAHRAVSSGTIDFNLTNNAVPYTTHCTGYSNRLTGYFYGDYIYTCDVPTGSGVTPDAAASFKFSASDGAFSVNQTWDCSETKKKYLGIGFGQADLTGSACVIEKWQNSNWTMGQLYSTYTTTCSPKDLNISPVVTTI